MKILGKILSTLLSVGIVFYSSALPNIFAGGTETLESKISKFMPETLEECCTALDEILSENEKNKIRESSINNPNSYLHRSCTFIMGNLGPTICHCWLYLPHQDGEIGSRKSKLAESLLDHGAGFDGEAGYAMACIILQNYRHYLRGEEKMSIEELSVDCAYNWWHIFNQDEPEERKKEFRERIERALKKHISSRENKPEQNASSFCTIL